jgi:hypothetical protein
MFDESLPRGVLLAVSSTHRITVVQNGDDLTAIFANEHNDAGSSFDLGEWRAVLN